jgi:hypothetical protein
MGRSAASSVDYLLMAHVGVRAEEAFLADHKCYVVGRAGCNGSNAGAAGELYRIGSHITRRAVNDHRVGARHRHGRA